MNVTRWWGHGRLHSSPLPLHNTSGGQYCSTICVQPPLHPIASMLFHRLCRRNTFVLSTTWNPLHFLQLHTEIESKLIVGFLNHGLCLYVSVNELCVNHSCILSGMLCKHWKLRGMGLGGGTRGGNPITDSCPKSNTHMWDMCVCFIIYTVYSICVIVMYMFSYQRYLCSTLLLWVLCVCLCSSNLRHKSHICSHSLLSLLKITYSHILCRFLQLRDDNHGDPDHDHEEWNHDCENWIPPLTGIWEAGGWKLDVGLSYFHDIQHSAFFSDNAMPPVFPFSL